MKTSCVTSWGGNVINTSFVERMNLTLRHHVPALAKRTIQIALTATVWSSSYPLQALTTISAYPAAV